MPQDLSNVEMSDDLSPKQKRLLVWRDYFELLQTGLMMKDEKGSEQDAWTEREVQISTYLDVVIINLRSDVMHLECGQEEYCQLGDVKDITSIDGNIDARKR